MPSLGALIVGLAAGLLGMAYVVYGRRAQRPAFILAGIAMCVYPYLVPGILLQIVVGALLAVVPVYFFPD